MGLSTPLHTMHVAQGATLVDFGGWDMPLHYGSQLAEHRAVRHSAGMFDVSHMGIIDVSGPRVREFLRQVLANDVAKLTLPGKALYSCMLLPTGGVIDDLIVYFIGAYDYRLVVNAGTREKDLAWLSAHARDFAVTIQARPDLAMIAVQGPHARREAASLLSAAHRDAALALPTFSGAHIGTWFVARTGYTGEDGFEIMLPAAEAVALWRDLTALGVQSVGLGARDTLRLEAGMNLYGNDMDETRHPLESGLGWTVAFEPAARDFVGREALQRVRDAAGPRLVGLVLEGRGVLRSHQVVTQLRDAAAETPVVDTKVVDAKADAKDTGPGAPRAADAVNARRGSITSGTFSPTLNRSIALARVPYDTGERVQVDIRGVLQPARVVSLPFVRRGKILVQI